MQAVINTCQALDSTIMNELVQSADNSGASASNTLIVIESELAGLAEEEEPLREARRAMLTSRNGSKSISKISNLPAEIHVLY